MDLNPKPPRHWFYTDFLNTQDELYEQGHNADYNYQHFTIADNQSLTTQQLKRELAKYNKNSVWYKADILGLRTSASGRIYTSYDAEDVIVLPSEIGKMSFIEFAVGIDVGGTDATVATLVGFTQRYKEVVLIDGLYDKQGLNERMSEHDYTVKVAKWLELWAKVFPRLSTIYVDSANKLFRVGMKEELIARNMSQFNVKFFDKSDGIKERIELNEQLFKQGRFKIASHMQHWINAYEAAVWDPNAYEKGEWVRLDNGSYEVDCLDSAEYAFYTQQKHLVQEEYGL